MKRRLEAATAGMCSALTGMLALGALPRVARVENAGLLFTDNQAGVSGVDAGYSLPIGKETLWLFGDVFLLHPTDPAKRYVGGLSNAALITSARTASGLTRYRFISDPQTGLARQVIPNLPGEGNETRLWPAGGWYDVKSRRAYLYWARIRTTGGGGPFDFRLEGHGLAVADATKPDEIRFERLKSDGGDELWWPHADGNAVYGAAVVRDPEARPRHLYIVGVQERDGRKIGKMARVSPESIVRSSAYEYFSGTPASPQWSADPSKAADIEGLTEFPSELSIAFNRYLGGYLAVHSIGISDRIRLSLADSPWGPYRQIAEIGAPHRAFEKAFCYAGKEHPELAEQNGKVVYVTYVDSQRYWLQLLKVTLER